MLRAVASALNQTRPVRVLVVEDCGPDPGLEAFVRGEFGDRISYIRNPRRRGLFDNWNACLELCPTEWLSILHDDDVLDPCFVESMIELNGLAPDCGLLCGHTRLFDTEGRLLQVCPPLPGAPWRRLELKDVSWMTPFPFAGHLFRVADARAVGGFRASSQFCGDWEMWVRLLGYCGAAQIHRLVGGTLTHSGHDRGCNRIEREGKVELLTFVQRKRVLALRRQRGEDVWFDRRKDLAVCPIPIRRLIYHGPSMRPMIFRYSVGLLLLSRPPHPAYALFRELARLFGPGFVRWAGAVGRKLAPR